MPLRGADLAVEAQVNNAGAMDAIVWRLARQITLTLAAAAPPVQLDRGEF